MTSKKSRRSLGRLVLWSSVLYLLALCGVLYSLDHCTEQQWYFGALLYLPPEGWLLPLVMLFPLALLTRPAICLLHVAAAVVVYMGFMDARAFSRKPAEVAVQVDSNDVLTVITANIGQRRVQNLQPFLERQQADVIAFQKVVYSPKAFLKKYPDYDVRVEDQFTLASKLPILNSGIVPDLTFEGRPVAAWFELNYGDRSVVIYDVHMPTPRWYLLGLRNSASVRDGELPSEEAEQNFQYYWTERFELARGLLAVLREEKRPMLVVGDFNTPDHGGLYQLFAAQLVDSFAVAGAGGGNTFPCNGSRKLSLLGPWMRLDYIFAGPDWYPIECAVEPPVSAEHLAVMGKYALLQSGSSPPAGQAASPQESGERVAAVTNFIDH